MLTSIEAETDIVLLQLELLDGQSYSTGSDRGTATSQYLKF